MWLRVVTLSILPTLPGCRTPGRCCRPRRLQLSMARHWCWSRGHRPVPSLMPIGCIPCTAVGLRPGLPGLCVARVHTNTPAHRMRCASATMLAIQRGRWKPCCVGWFGSPGTRPQQAFDWGFPETAVEALDGKIHACRPESVSVASVLNSPRLGTEPGIHPLPTVSTSMVVGPYRA